MTLGGAGGRRLRSWVRQVEAGSWGQGMAPPVPSAGEGSREGPAVLAVLEGQRCPGAEGVGAPVTPQERGGTCDCPLSDTGGHSSILH